MRLRLGSTCHTGELVKARNHTANRLPFGQVVSVHGYAEVQMGPEVVPYTEGQRPHGLIATNLGASPSGVCNVYRQVELRGIDTRAASGEDAPVYADADAELGFGYAPADAEGRARYVIGVVVRHDEDGAVLFDFTNTAAIGAADGITTNLLADKPHHTLAGVASVVVRFAGDVEDGDRLVLQVEAGGRQVSRVYEADTSPNSSLNQGADVRIDVSQIATAAAAASAFAAAVNGDGLAFAHVTATAEVCVLAPQAENLRLTAPVNRNGSIIVCKASDQRRVIAPQGLHLGSYILTAADVAALRALSNVLLVVVAAPRPLDIHTLQGWRASTALGTVGLACSVVRLPGPDTYGLLLLANEAAEVLLEGDRVCYTLAEG